MANAVAEVSLMPQAAAEFVLCLVSAASTCILQCFATTVRALL